LTPFFVHELGHLFLGHLGLDKALSVPDRASTKNKSDELEAESVAYLVCSRHGVENKSESYLSNYVNKNHTVDQLDIYQIMRAAGQVETLFGLGAHTRFEPKKRKSK
jgi:antirestriction protein ArdC